MAGKQDGAKTGRFAIIEQFLADGMDHMFGNPGHRRAGLSGCARRISGNEIHLDASGNRCHVDGDGYARATQRPTLVQMH